MTASEFKSWLAGFSEAIDESPTPEQWAKVRETLALVAEPLFAPSTPARYQPPLYIPPYTTCGSATFAGPVDVKN